MHQRVPFEPLVKMRVPALCFRIGGRNRYGERRHEKVRRACDGEHDARHLPFQRRRNEDHALEAILIAQRARRCNRCGCAFPSAGVMTQAAITATATIDLVSFTGGRLCGVFTDALCTSPIDSACRWDPKHIRPSTMTRFEGEPA